MTRRCTVCGHPDRDLIDASVVGGAPNRRIAALHGLTEASIRRHAGTHVPATLALARGAAESSRADVLLAQAEALRTDALELLDEAREKGDLRTAVSAIGQARGCWNCLHAWAESCPHARGPDAGPVAGSPRGTGHCSGPGRVMSVAGDLAVALDPTRLMTACGLTPDPWQEAFLRERPARPLLLASRQAGKSTVTAACALHEAVYRPPSTVLLLSPAQRQSAELLARVRALLNRLPDRPVIASEGALSVRLANGSRILSLPGTESTVRGFSADLLVIDEAARVEDALYEAVRPMLAVTGGRLVALSTPSGRRGWFWEAWSGRERWHRSEVPAHLVPRISREFLDEERRTLPNLVFASEYECEFVDPLASVFSSKDVLAALDDNLVPLFGATA